jgi:hypothetical protein
MLQLKRVIAAAVAAVTIALAVFGMFAGLSGSVPDEARLISLTGYLRDLRTSGLKDGRTSVSFSVTPVAGAPVELHMRDFGITDLARRLRMVESRAVTVRYRELPFGRPVYAIAGPDGDIVSFAQARAFLEAEDREKAPDYLNGLVLYLGFPLALVVMFAVYRRTVPRDGSLPPRALEDLREAHKLHWHRAFGFAGIGAVVLILAHDAYRRPQTLAPLIGVFGPSPLGLSPLAAYALLTALVFAPLIGMMWHLIGLAHAAQKRDGVLRMSKLALLMAAWRHWGDCVVRRHAIAALLFLALFALIGGAWIIAAARAGV